ncbi:Glycine cleavage H-protein [Frankia sp. EI5c]|nr:Glycine cleavage H-protein [Frankia sp. EI5c]
MGESVSAGEPCGEVESTKSVSDIYAPVSGTVAARNEALVAAPELVNSDPYGDGWLVEVTVAEPGVLDDLLDAAQYTEHVKEQ